MFTALACNAIDNGGTDIGCENECPPPFPAPSTKDQEKAKQKPNTEKRNCAVRAIIDRQGAQRYYKRTLEGSGTVAIMPRHLDAFERM